MGCKKMELPSTYLRLGAKHNQWLCGKVEEKFRKKLSMWQREYISKGGKVTLIKSTLKHTDLYDVPF